MQTSSSTRKRKGQWSGAKRTIKRRRPVAPPLSRGITKLPALQKIIFQPANPSSGWSWPVTGISVLLSKFQRGSDDANRKTNDTVIYNVDVNLIADIDDTQKKYVNKSWGMVFLVYDAQPQGTQPGAGDIFDIDGGYATNPIAWRVKRNLTHRFVVKRKYKILMEVNGIDRKTQATNGMGVFPCNNVPSIQHFVKGLNVRTEWKNTAGDGYGDISKGGLVMICVPAGGLIGQVRGDVRVYFKSVGN